VLAKEEAAVQKQAYLGDILNHPQIPLVSSRQVQGYFRYWSNKHLDINEPKKKKKKIVENEEHHNEDGTMVHTQLMPLAMTACPAHDRHMDERDRGLDSVFFF